MGGVKDMYGYKRNPKPQGVFSSEDSLLIFGTLPGDGIKLFRGAGANSGDTQALGYLVQNWNVNYAQQVMELFELGSNALYWAKGRPVGQGTLGRIIGWQGAGNTFFPKEAYDLCDGGAMMEIKAASGGCGDTKRVTLRMDGVVVTTFGFNMQVQDTALHEAIGWRFAAMELA